jgi:hypothetical protein
MAVLVPSHELPKYGFPNYSNRHRWRLEKIGVLPPRVAISRNRSAYVEAELIAYGKAFVDALIAKRDAKRKLVVPHEAAE